MPRRSAFAAILLLVASSVVADELVLGSKVFTESVVLGEIAAQVLRSDGIETVHRREVGGTTVLWSAMQRGDIDCYPEYSGTLRGEIFANKSIRSDADLRRELDAAGVWSSPPLGFNNTYVLGMREPVANRLNVERISDLALHPQLRLGFSNEFLERRDGWPGVRERYGLTQTNVAGMAHDLAYRALASNAIDLSDLYSTDPEIAYYELRALKDDRNFFPEYQALIICRADIQAAGRRSIERLAGSIDEVAMARLNAQVKLQRKSEASVASEFVRERFGISTVATADTRARRIARRTVEHLAMVLLSLVSAILVALPLGVLAYQRPGFAKVAFTMADVVQTIPALALLVFLIPWLGIGYAPAIVALFLYSLLPILRNTHAGLADIPRELRESAEALGLSALARLRRIELPLAARSILAGIKTAAVINVGTATLGALIGAGGYGQPILTGIRLDDSALILEGAIPSALLALCVQALFSALEKRFVRAH